MTRRWAGAVLLVVALAAPTFATIATPAAAVAADPAPCVGTQPESAYDQPCVPADATDDGSVFTPDPIETSNDPLPYDDEYVQYAATVPTPGLPVCTHFDGGIPPCFRSEYRVLYWYTGGGSGFFSDNSAGTYWPSGYTALNDNGTAYVHAYPSWGALFLVEVQYRMYTAPSTWVYAKAYALLDARAPAPPPDDENHPPVAGFTVEQVAPTDFALWRFTSTAADPDAGDSITTQTWDFGDGGINAGGQVIHTFEEPGTYTVTHRVVDSHGAASETSQPLVVPAPSLHVDLALPDAPTNQLVPGQETVARLTVRADDGVGALSSVKFDGPILTATPDGAVVVELGEPPPIAYVPFTLDPGDSVTVDLPIRADASGAFTLASTVHAIDTAGRPVGPVTGSVDGTVSGLAVELRSGATGQDTIDVVVSVANTGSSPLEDIRYRSDGPVLHPEYVPDALRGEVAVVAGPMGALPTRLEPGETREARYTYRADAPGDVAVTVDVTATAGDAEVTADDSGFIGAQKRALDVEQLQDILAQLAQGELDNLQARARQWQQYVNSTLNARLAAARARGALVDFPADVVQRLGDAAGPVVPYPEIDNVKLTAAAIGGYAKGLGRGIGNVVQFTVGTPAEYWASIVTTGDFGQAAQDYADAGKATQGTADALAYGAFSNLFRLWDGLEASSQGAFNPQQYTDLTEALNDEYKGQMLRYAEIAPDLQRQQAEFDAYLDKTEDDILHDPYGWADKVTGAAGELGGETLAGEAVTRGGVKLAESAMSSYEYSRYGQSGAAIKRVTEAETLEMLGAGETTAANVERLGGITESDQQKIQQVIAEVKEKFGIDLEIQARPSNPHSVQYLNSKLGAVGKPEIFKAKNISDIDVIIGADQSALGKLGVFEPHLPPENVMAKMPSELATEVRNRYATQKKVWRDWNDPDSVFRKNYEKAAKPGGGSFDFDVPTAAGDAAPSAPRKYKIEVELSKPGRNATQTFFERTTGKPIVSDVDFHGFFKTNGRMPDAGTRGQLELFLQNRWKQTNIAFGDHGATLNGFDWAGSGTAGGAVARHKFGLEFMEPAAARARAEELAVQYGVPVEKLLEGYVPGKFVVSFRRGSVAVGYGKTF